MTRSKKRLLELENEVQVINKKVKNISDEEKDKIINDSNNNSDNENTEEEYDEEEYEDLSEYIEQFKSKDKQAYNSFVETSFYLSNLEPDILEILKTPMKLKDRAKLVELYEIYKCIDMPTEEGIILRKRINKSCKKFAESYRDMQKKDKEDIVMQKLESKRIKNSTPKLDLKTQILNLQTSSENKLTIYRKYKDLQELNEQDESSKLRNWLKWSLNIPHDKVKESSFEKESISSVLNRTKKYLDKELYGMDKVKEQLLLFLNSKLQNKNMKGCSIGLLGPPGTGKTAIAKTLSKCLDFPFEQISFGGVSDPEFLTGHDYTYIGSRPGEIVRCLSRMGYKNGIIFLDEFEKTSGKKGISSTLLHLTDFTQNHEFRDNYLADITIDLSNIWFIYSMNSLPEDSALKDRIFTINVEGYNTKDKIQIVQNYLLPRAIKNIGRNDNDITISEENALYLINKIDKGNENKGVRNLEKNIKDIVNKIHFLVSNKKEGILQIGFNITFDVKDIIQYPVHISKESIDRFIEDTSKDEVYLNMFL